MLRSPDERQGDNYARSRTPDAAILASTKNAHNLKGRRPQSNYCSQLRTVVLTSHSSPLSEERDGATGDDHTFVRDPG